MAKKKTKKNRNYKQTAQSIVPYTPGKTANVKNLEEPSNSQYSSLDIQTIKNVKALCLKYPGLTVNQILNSHDALKKSYQKGLEAADLIPTARELETLPRIHMPDETLTDIKFNGPPEQDFLTIIPPFQSFVIATDCLQQGDNSMLHIYVDDCDLEKHEARITTNLYIKHNNKPDYSLEARGTYKVDIENGTIQVQILELYEPQDIAQIIHPDNLNWAQIDKDVWQKYVIPATISAARETRPQTSNVARMICQLATNHIYEINKLLDTADLTSATQTDNNWQSLTIASDIDGKTCTVTVQAQPDDWQKFIAHKTGEPDPFEQLIIIPTPSIYRKGRYQKDTKYTDCIIISKYTKRADVEKISRLQMKYPGLTSLDMYTINHCLDTQYSAALMDLGIIPSPIAIRTANIIDVTDTWLHDPTCTEGTPQYKAHRDTLNAYAWSTGFYSTIPCFETGILKIGNIHHYFELTSIDLTNQTFDIKIYHYESYEDMMDQDIKIHTPKWCEYLANTGAYGHMLGIYAAHVALRPDYKQIKNPAGQDMSPFVITGTYEFLADDLYRYIPDYKFNRTPVEQDMWNLNNMRTQKAERAYRIDEAQKQKEFIQNHNGIWPETEYPIAQAIIGQFLTEITETNRAMTEHTATTKTTRSDANKKTIQVKAEPTEFNPQDKIVRHFGKIKISSRTEPRTVNAATIKQYKIASWSVRGHIRHLKNGKTIYIKPTVATRKCLQDGQTATPGIIAKIHT